MTKSIDIALSGLNAANKRISASASNIANLRTVGSLKDGGQAPYTPLSTQQVTGENGGVDTQFVARQDPFVPTFEPGSPFADEEGVIGVPNISLPEEIVSLSLAKYQFQASLSTIDVEIDLTRQLLEVFDRDV